MIESGCFVLPSLCVSLFVFPAWPRRTSPHGGASQERISQHLEVSLPEGLIMPVLSNRFEPLDGPHAPQSRAFDPHVITGLILVPFMIN